jgi:hypothetical protein
MADAAIQLIRVNRHVSLPDVLSNVAGIREMSAVTKATPPRGNLTTDLAYPHFELTPEQRSEG